jgi:hypothetical protein
LVADELHRIRLEPLTHMNSPTLHDCATRSGNRRKFLKTTAAAGMAWMNPLATQLARCAENDASQVRGKAIIQLWMAGGPSQLETFDPHPAQKGSENVKAISTSVKDLQIAQSMEAVAELMDDVSLIRSMISQEGDHERAVYNVKTGYRPNPTVVHPSLGSIICHELPENAVEIPRHISILPNEWPARGGYLGAAFDAFQIGDPGERIPDVLSPVGEERMEKRLAGLDVVERAFLSGRDPKWMASHTRHRATIDDALRMMDSDQIKAFDVNLATEAERKAYGDTEFGRGCLAARRLVETGVRCIEVTLSGWDSHVNNHETQSKRIATLAPALAALIRDLKERALLENTIVLCGGEFGRTPELNPLEGRDHWPHGFSFLIGGGGIAGGKVIGSTDPEGISKSPENPVRVQDLHATIQHSLGIDPEKEIITPVGRPIFLSEGNVVRELLGAS